MINNKSKSRGFKPKGGCKVAPPADFDVAEHVNNTEIVREPMCKAMNETVWPRINATCFDADDLVGMSKRGCSIECEGLVVPYFEQCVFEYGIGGFSRFNETDEMDEEDALAANATGPVVRLGTAAEIMEPLQTKSRSPKQPTLRF